MPNTGEHTEQYAVNLNIEATEELMEHLPFARTVQEALIVCVNNELARRRKVAADGCGGESSK